MLYILFCSVLFNFVLFCSFASSNSACWISVFECKEGVDFVCPKDVKIHEERCICRCQLVGSHIYYSYEDGWHKGEVNRDSGGV